MRRKMLLDDDMKEYWGFYLLAGSVFRVESCSRYEGASLVIIKGSKDAARCSWLGELDSQEESDELSNEFDFASKIVVEYSSNPEVKSIGDEQSEKENESEEVEDDSIEIEDITSYGLEENRGVHGLLSSSSREANKYLDNIGQWSLKSQRLLLKNLMANLNEKSKNVNEKNNKLIGTSDIELSITGNMEQNYNESNKAKKDINEDNAFLENRVTTDIEDYHTEGEDFLEDTDHLFNSGKFDQNNLPSDKEDKSDEEQNSSWSSSEEALETCEGVIHNHQLLGQVKCGQNMTEADLHSAMKEFSYLVEKSGFYYFVFSNENEITQNFIAANFELQKTVFDVDISEEKCLNSSTCSLPLSFLSSQHVVVEVPGSESDTCEYEAEGITNYHNCHTVLKAESICEPRGAVYLIFLLLVPVLILMFASI